jgi:hypothetical protein
MKTNPLAGLRFFFAKMTLKTGRELLARFGYNSLYETR